LDVAAHQPERSHACKDRARTEAWSEKKRSAALGC
jgi:hypothetical protein